MYLGEIVRRVLHRMAEDTRLFGISVPEKLKTPFSLRYKLLLANLFNTRFYKMVCTNIILEFNILGDVLFQDSGYMQHAGGLVQGSGSRWINPQRRGWGITLYNPASKIKIS